MARIKLTVPLETGEMKIDAQGFRGKTCKDATDFLRETLGECTDFQEKASWYEENIEKDINSNLCG